MNKDQRDTCASFNIGDVVAVHQDCLRYISHVRWQARKSEQHETCNSHSKHMSGKHNAPPRRLLSRGSTPNATLQARPMAGARDERRLLGVACKRLLGSESVPDSFSAPDFNAHAMHWLHRSGGIRCCATHVGRAHSFWLATRAPSARAPSFAQAIVGTTIGAPAKVAKPQSTPGTTFSRPTSSA